MLTSGPEHILILDDQSFTVADADASINVAVERSDHVDGIECSQDVDRRFERIFWVFESGEEIVGIELDYPPAVVTGTGLPGRLLHLVNHGKVMDDAVLDCQPREPAHIQDQHGHLRCECLTQMLIDFRRALRILIAFRKQLPQQCSSTQF